MLKQLRSTAFTCLIMLFGSLFISCHQGQNLTTHQDESWQVVSEEAQNVLATIYHANRFYRDDNGKDAESVDILIKEEYLALGDEAVAWFTYSMTHLDGKLTEIIATTTDASPVGYGRTILYIVDSEEK